MFNKDFYPTVYHVIEMMLEGINLTDKVILEPSSGKGDIVDYCLANGAKEVIACELHDELRTIVASKCKVIAPDFLQVTSDMISHIDLIIMNPPFSADEKHINHAFEIAPAGCKIISLCNYNTIKLYNESRERRKLKTTIDSYGNCHNLGDVFNNDAERGTKVDIGLISLQKPGMKQQNEFEGFFLEDDPTEDQYNGIMPYNFVRDLVNRYVAAVKIYDEQLESAVRMNNLTSGFYKSSLSMSITEDQKPKTRNDFKKDLQKSAWMYIFEKMNMQKYLTKKLKEEINQFVEDQVQVPFTMRNIYRMLDIVIGTHAGRMDKALMEVFDNLTMHTHENRYNVEGWKTNSHYMLNPKFIMDHIRYDIIQDFAKALCFISGKNYDDFQTLESRLSYPVLLKNTVTGRYERSYYNNSNLASFRNLEDYERYAYQYKDKPVEPVMQEKKEYGKWLNWGFFDVRIYKKGTIHFKFKDMDLWAKFNQHIARIMGYPLFEPVKKAA
jgi:predicted RNA methylase